jgi:hypothetical protein
LEDKGFTLVIVLGGRARRTASGIAALNRGNDRRGEADCNVEIAGGAKNGRELEQCQKDSRDDTPARSTSGSQKTKLAALTVRFSERTIRELLPLKAMGA